MSIFYSLFNIRKAPDELFVEYYSFFRQNIMLIDLVLYKVQNPYEHTHVIFILFLIVA